jgi:hypothetical protein
LAVQRGRANVGFLVLLTVAAIALAHRLSFPRLTSAGRAILQDVQTLYGGLKDRVASIRPGGATIEPMMLAAAFGVDALAGDAFAYTQTLFPQRRRSASPSWWSDTSGVSSCGSSGSSCGSSCGGGCGGGCGGCGS